MAVDVHRSNTCVSCVRVCKYLDCVLLPVVYWPKVGKEASKQASKHTGTETSNQPARQDKARPRSYPGIHLRKEAKKQGSTGTGYEFSCRVYGFTA